MNAKAMGLLLLCALAALVFFLQLPPELSGCIRCPAALLVFVGLIYLLSGIFRTRG